MFNNEQKRMWHTSPWPRYEDGNAFTLSKSHSSCVISSFWSVMVCTASLNCLLSSWYLAVDKGKSKVVHIHSTFTILLKGTTSYHWNILASSDFSTFKFVFSDCRPKKKDFNKTAIEELLLPIFFVNFVQL